MKTPTPTMKIQIPSTKPAATTSPTIIIKPSITPTPTLKPTRTPTPTAKPTITPSPTRTPSAAPATSTLLDEKQSYMLNAINVYRRQNGIADAKADTYTCSFANTRAKEIVTSFNHDGFQNRVNNHTLPYPSYTSVTENIAMTSNYKEVVTLWINSSGHAANMRRDTPYICVGYSGNFYAMEGWRP